MSDSTQAAVDFVFLPLLFRTFTFYSFLKKISRDIAPLFTPGSSAGSPDGPTGHGHPTPMSANIAYMTEPTTVIGVSLWRSTTLLCIVFLAPSLLVRCRLKMASNNNAIVFWVRVPCSFITALRRRSGGVNKRKWRISSLTFTRLGDPSEPERMRNERRKNRRSSCLVSLAS